MSVIDQNTPDIPNATLDGGEWYLDDQTTVGISDITLRYGKGYINNLEFVNVADTTNYGGEWYLNETEELAYLFSCAFDSSCTDMCSNTYTKTSPGDDSGMGKHQALWTAFVEFLPSRELIKNVIHAQRMGV